MSLLREAIEFFRDVVESDESLRAAEREYRMNPTHETKARYRAEVARMGQKQPHLPGLDPHDDPRAYAGGLDSSQFLKKVRRLMPDPKNRPWRVRQALKTARLSSKLDRYNDMSGSRGRTGRPVFRIARGGDWLMHSHPRYHGVNTSPYEPDKL